jgi:hypothetical protein
MIVKFSANHFYLPLSPLIRLWTWSRYSHCEFVFSNGVSIFPAMEVGVVISTKKKYPIQTFVEVDLTPEEERKLYHWAKTQVGVPYDYTALAPFNVLIPRKKKQWKDPSLWMCSEFCAYGLDRVGVKLFEDDKRKITPGDVFRKLTQHPKARIVEMQNTQFATV